MYQQTNVNETATCQGDAINQLFAQHYKAILRTAYRILRLAAVMMLRELDAEAVGLSALAAITIVTSGLLRMKWATELPKTTPTRSF